MVCQKIVNNLCHQNAKTGVKPFVAGVMHLMLLHQPIAVLGAESAYVDLIHPYSMAQQHLAIQALSR